MTRAQKLLVNLVAPPAVMAVIHATWQVEIVSDLPLLWGIAYLFAMLLVAWVLAELFNQTILKTFGPRAIPAGLRYLLAAMPAPFLTHLWYRDLREVVLAFVPPERLGAGYVPVGGPPDTITLLLMNWFPWIALWVAFKFAAEHFGFGLDPAAPRAKEGMTAAPAAAPLPTVLREAGFDRMPDLHALQAQEHYVVVHTQAGTEMVRYRMSDAVEDCGRVFEGLRVHRSWWVAKSAIEAVEPRGRSLSLRLPSGDWIPVSLAAKQAVLDTLSGEVPAGR